MNRKHFKIILCLLSIFLLGCINVSAAEFKRVEKTDTEIFAIPNGGYEMMNYNVVYTEYYYLYNSNYHCYNKRGRFYGVAYDLFSACPMYLRIGNVIHFNGNTQLATFNTWANEDAFASGEWTYFGYQVNNVSKTYSKTSGYTGKMMYGCECPDAIVPYRYYSVSLNL